MNYRIFGAFLIVVAIIILSTVAYRNSRRRQDPLVFSSTYMLNGLWASYKKNYIESSSDRTIDKQRNNVTTSEGESYTLLRAVWQDDKPTFDKSWQWTKTNLQRPSDHLFSWLYGQKNDGNYGILADQGGQNTATDADTDIALALLLASNRWQDNSYLDEAKKIIPSIWENEVVQINGIPYVAADDVEKTAQDAIVVNPSYFAPYAYKLFARADADHNWQKTVDSSYAIIEKSSQAALDKQLSKNMPPDWISLNKTTGEIITSSPKNLTSNYGYDALRVPFRLSLDYLWNHDERALQTLKTFSFLDTEWQTKHALASTYGHDGNVITATEAPAMYGGSLGYFLVANPPLAEEVYSQKLQSLYQPDSQDWKQQLSYYDDNWAWFGMALYNNRLINYYK